MARRVLDKNKTTLISFTENLTYNKFISLLDNALPNNIENSKDKFFKKRNIDIDSALCQRWARCSTRALGLDFLPDAGLGKDVDAWEFFCLLDGDKKNDIKNAKGMKFFTKDRFRDVFGLEIDETKELVNKQWSLQTMQNYVETNIARGLPDKILPINGRTGVKGSFSIHDGAFLFGFYTTSNYKKTSIIKGINFATDDKLGHLQNTSVLYPNYRFTTKSKISGKEFKVVPITHVGIYYKGLFYNMAGTKVKTTFGSNFRPVAWFPFVNNAKKKLIKRGEDKLPIEFFRKVDCCKFNKRNFVIGDESKNCFTSETLNRILRNKGLIT